jgi:hypothetical protein
MYAAMLLMLSFVALAASIHQYARPERKIYGVLGLCAAVASATVLLINYFVQVTVMHPSLEKNQLDGWSMLTQYNPNGVFIALEELGYLLMSLALLCAAPALEGDRRTEKFLRRLFALSFSGNVAALIAVTVVRGIDRGDLFEVIVICIVWTTLVVAVPVLAVVFRRRSRELDEQPPGKRVGHHSDATSA